MSDLEQRLGFCFRDARLLEQALTHRSFLEDRSQNERLEFLGDAVLGLIAARNLYLKFPNSNEGTLTQLRALYVCQANLVKAAERLGLGRYLRVAKAMRLSGAVQQASILSDVVEALIGAAYLDQDFEAAERLAMHLLGPLPDQLNAPIKSSKTELQELIQAKHSLAPIYELVDVTGPAHQPQFRVRVLIHHQEVAIGEGHNKKEASEAAAAKALASYLQ
ncbi:MAG: ribonuclease III [Myxococcaceae bacterium]|nr:ribonuclease III [Myxococcaceae bacterium]MBH2006716.1 ribonuclease III [Myxococcaceae bacterium]